MSYEQDVAEKRDFEINDANMMGSDVTDDTASERHRGTMFDVKDMHRLGKKQEFMRNFRFYSILGFTSTLMCTWEAILATSAFSLTNGGRAGLIWTYLGTVLSMIVLVMSMADMASMAPTSGGQYHWVSEFAPKSCQKFLSYITAWVSALGWQAGVASASYLSGTMCIGLIALWNENYVRQRWHETLFTIAVASIATFFNTLGARQLPILEGFILTLHVFGFFGVLIPLWVLAPKTSAANVFTKFEDNGGWGSIGTACIVGMIGPIFSFIGPDSGIHMSEEIRDASKVVPHSMIATACLNAVLGFVMVITYCFCIDDVVSSLESSTGYPFIDVFYKSTGSKVGATVMTTVIILLITSATISILATASRQTFAFARDEGLPFAATWRKVTKLGTEIPLNSVLLCLTVTVVLALTNIGSTTAFNQIVSLFVSSLFLGYFISVGCILLKRLRGQPLPPSRWSMGRMAIPVNILTMCYITFAFIMSFFPVSPVDLSPESMNWSVMVLFIILALSCVAYLVTGRHVYKGPVVYVDRSYEQQGVIHAH